jgi:hypothetical protein
VRSAPVVPGHPRCRGDHHNDDAGVPVLGSGTGWTAAGELRRGSVLLTKDGINKRGKAVLS